MHPDQSFSRYVALKATETPRDKVEQKLATCRDPESRLEVFTCMAAHAMLDVSTPPVVIRPTKPLMERIEHSDIDEMCLADIPLPFHAFVVDLGDHENPGARFAESVRIGITSMLFTGGSTDAEVLIFTIFGMFASNSWDSMSCHMSLTDSIATFMERGAAVRGTADEMGDTLSWLMRAAIGVALYVSSESAEVTDSRKRVLKHYDSKLVLPPIRSTAKLSARKAEKDLLKQRRFVAGRSLRLLKQHANTIVRGHFRRQAHGPKHSLRKIIWIQPHVRLPDETHPVFGRDIEATG